MKSQREKNMENQQLKKILAQQLNSQVETYGLTYISQLIKEEVQFRQQKSFVIFNCEKGKNYLKFLWDNYYNKELPGSKTNQFNENQQDDRDKIYVLPIFIDVPAIILKTVKERQCNIKNQIQQGTLIIQGKDTKSKYQKLKLQNQKQLLQNQLNLLNNDIQNIQEHSRLRKNKLNESKAQSRVSQTNFTQFIKNQKLEKQKRKEMIQLHHQKELQNQKKKIEEQKMKQEKQEQQKMQQKRKRQKQLFQKRSKQKQTRTKHQSMYLDQINKIFKREQSVKTPNVQTMLQRYQSQQLKKIKKQKQKLFKSYQKTKIDQHQKQYRQAREKINEQRKSKMQQINSIQKIENQKSRIKFHSSFSFSLPHQQYQKRKKQEYQIAKQKRNRILSYKDKVKNNFLPQVDQGKKREMLQILQQIELSKKGPIKKKILQNGQVVIEKVDVKDSNDVGLNYLQNVKQMVQKMRKNKKQKSQFEQISSHQESTQQKSKKPIDYLKQMRQKGKTSSTATSFLSPRTTAFFKTKSSSMSFEQKLKKIQDVSTKILQRTKQQEMMLKYGKFKTSQQILNKREIIDKNYLDLVNMKLQIIENDEGEIQY